MVILQARVALDILTHGANGNVRIVLLTFTCLRPRAATIIFRTIVQDAHEFIVRDAFYTIYLLVES